MDIKKIIREELQNSWGWADEIPSAYQWLKDNFSDLKRVTTENVVTYVDKKSNLPMVHYYLNIQTAFIFINNSEIWSKLRHRFKLSHDKIREILTEWLEDVYSLTGRVPAYWNLNG